MTLDCYDFDAGQCRHFPAGDYRRQTETVTGRAELELMRLLWRCWVVFKFRKESDWTVEDMDFAFWVQDKPKPKGRFDSFVVNEWQQLAA